MILLIPPGQAILPYRMMKHKSDSGCKGLEFILNLAVVREYK